jgi:hypothetical protein
MSDSQASGQKRTRKKNTSSGVRKNRGECAGRKSPVVVDFAGLNLIRHQAAHRWPSVRSLEKCWELAKDRKGSGRRRGPAKPIKPGNDGFTLLDMLIDKGSTLDTLLTAASLQFKKVRRYPGYVLIRTYNLKDRPIEII